MSDWIEQLERLTRLHKDGALTDAEFAEQKARLLAESEAGAAGPAGAEEAVYYEEPPARRGISAGWLAGGLIGAGLLGWAGWMVFGQGRGPDPELTATGAPSASASVAASATPSPTPTPTPVALDGTLAFASPSQCTAGETLERIYRKLDLAMEQGNGRGLSVKLDAWETPLALSAKAATGADGVRNSSAEVRFPAGTTWHGLALSRVTTEGIEVPESDGGYSRTINFLAPPAEVQRTLARLGFGAPRSPAFAELEDGGCGGSMEIEAIGGGSRLRCSWGC